MIQGHGPSPSLVLAMVRALPDDSLTHALMLGGREHFGWGYDRHILASIFDSIQQNTIATGSWKKGKAPKMEPWPRPQKRHVKKRMSVMEMFSKIKKPEGNPYE